MFLHRPLYLITNMSGRKYPSWANHFDPYSPIYSRRERSEILISDCALGLAFSGLYSLAKTFGWLWLAKVSCTVPSPSYPATSLGLDRKMPDWCRVSVNAEVHFFLQSSGARSVSESLPIHTELKHSWALRRCTSHRT